MSSGRQPPVARSWLVKTAHERRREERNPPLTTGVLHMQIISACCTAVGDPALPGQLRGEGAIPGQAHTKKHQSYKANNTVYIYTSPLWRMSTLLFVAMTIYLDFHCSLYDNWGVAPWKKFDAWNIFKEYFYYLDETGLAFLKGQVWDRRFWIRWCPRQRVHDRWSFYK